MLCSVDIFKALLLHSFVSLSDSKTHYDQLCDSNQIQTVH